MDNSSNALLDRVVDTALLDSLFDELTAAEPRTFKPTPYFGEFTVDSFSPDKFDDTALASWHIAVRPLSFTLKSATGAFHAYEKVKLNKDGKISPQSATGRVLESYRSNLGPDENGRPLKPGKSALVGRVGWFQNETLEFGKDKRELNADGAPNPNFGQVIKAGRPSIMMIRPGTPEEIAQYLHGVTPTVSAEFSREDAAAALSVIEGKKATIYQKGLMRNESLSAAVKAAILNGDMQKFLVSNGYAVEEDGVLIQAEA